MDILSSVFRNTNGGEDALPLLVSSFKLFSRLKSISEGDGNDDAQDAWAARKGGLFTALASTIDTFGKPSPHSPRRSISNHKQTRKQPSTSLAT